MRLRVSIACLMALVGFCGLAFASLRSPSIIWANTTFTLALGVLTVAILKVLSERRAPRAFWSGFAACGWLYLLLNLLPPFATDVSPHLITTTLLDASFPWVIPPTPLQVGMGRGNLIFQQPSYWEDLTRPPPNYGMVGGTGGIRRYSPPTYLRIGHSLVAMLAASGGGLLALRFHRKVARRDRHAEIADEAAKITEPTR